MRMRKTMTAVMLAAATGVAAMVASNHGLHAQAAPTDEQRNTPPKGAMPPANANAAVPVKQVVLFSSGVGYFEHFGSIQGDGSTELRFKSQQINDILKSLILQDLDGGQVTAVNYPSQDPLEKTLKSFEVDITGNPSLHDLLNQLRGARVSVTDEQGKTLSGTILGVEMKQRPVPQKEGEPKVIEIAVLNLLTGTGIRSVEMEHLTDIQLQDPQLREELDKALAAVAQARGQDKKPVAIHFRGQGERRVRLGYVVETPIWKTSYRLILSDAPGGVKPAEAAANPKGQGGVGGDRLQGWAIVENQTDFDWNDVQLSLVSGRPISFIQDLYQPLYIPRPVVKPELYASLRPQTYDAGMALREEVAMQLADKPDANMEAMERRAQRGALAKSAAPMAAGRAGGYGGYGGGYGAPAAAVSAPAPEPLDAAASVSSAASAAKLGELFQYTVGSVSLPRQKSAMIPIVTDPIEVEKLSIYNAAVLAKNPLYGARLKNTTGKHLLQGPITVLANGAYAGDAKIDDLPPSQERLISYGVDLEVRVDSTKNKQESSILTGKIVKGALEVSYKDVFTQDYLAENKADKAKTLVIEHPVRPGWKLVQPEKPEETTEQLYRFKGKLEPGKTNKLSVVQQNVRGESVALLQVDPSALLYYSRVGQIPKEVRDAIVKAMQLRQAMADIERQIQEREARVNQVTQEQARMRENMKTVAQNTDYYKRLLKKLDDQESVIDKTRMEVDSLRTQLEQRRAELEQYLGSLSVG